MFGRSTSKLTMLSQTNPNRGANHELPPVLESALKQIKFDANTSKDKSTNADIKDTSTNDGKADSVELGVDC